MTALPDPKKTNTIGANDFISLMAELLSADVAKERGVAGVRNVRKRMEKLGADMRALDLVIQLRRLEPEAAVLRLRNALRYARWLDMEVGKTGDLFVGADDADQPAEGARREWTDAEIRQQGFEAGKAGRDATDHKFMPGTPAHQTFYDGWCEGQGVLAAELGTERPEKGTLKRPARGKQGKLGVESRQATPKGRGGRRGKRGAMDAARDHLGG